MEEIYIMFYDNKPYKARGGRMRSYATKGIARGALTKIIQEEKYLAPAKKHDIEKFEIIKFVRENRNI